MHFPFFGKNKKEEGRKDVQDAAAHGVAVMESSGVLPRANFFVRVWRGCIGIPKFFKETFLRLVLFVILLIFYITVRGSFSLYCRARKVFRRDSVRSSEVMFAELYGKIERLFRIKRRESIDRISLIGIAVRNMKVKKTRTAITIGGMAMGIASIVFLVSLGYGVQRLVISQVARLDEMRQADISPQAGGKVKIDDSTLASLKEIPNVESVAPLVAVVGKVNYQGSVSDMAVYAVTSDYLRQSAIQPSSGTIFESNDLSARLPDRETVAGVSDTKPMPPEFGNILEAVEVRSLTDTWVRLRESPDPKSRLLGMIRVSSAGATGNFVAGKPYGSTIPETGEAYRNREGAALGKWVSIEAPVWEKAKDCFPSNGCVAGFSPLTKNDGTPKIEQGYFALVDDDVAVLPKITERELKAGDEIDGDVLISEEGYVLGESTESGVSESALVETSADENAVTTEASVAESLSSEEGAASPASTEQIQVSSSEGEWVEIDLGDNAEKNDEVERVALGEAAKREAVVNRAMLQVLGLADSEALGKKFSVSFVVTGSLLGGGKTKKLESIDAEYTILGVVPDDKTPIFYVPFLDVRTLGVVNFSQVKLTTVNQESLPNVRRQIEGMGFVTTSVSDTVEQINNFFGTARIVLALLGMAALGVAALGMFNTLTVSLLERTREVGLMKAMGMKAYEVQELFLTESMMMAFFGGIFGLLFGFLSGKALGLAISTVAFLRDKNMGVLDVAYIPNVFVVTILLFSLAVGVLTGLYPARRATKISALNALRYE